MTDAYWSRDKIRTILSNGYNNVPGFKTRGIDAVLDGFQEHILAAPLDLHDPATANAVAEAIARYKGHYLPLNEAYPWRNDV